MSIERVPSEHPKNDDSASSIDHSSKTLDSRTSPPATPEQVTEPVGSKPWDIPAPAAEGPDQRRGAGRESPREQTTLEKIALYGAVGLSWFGSGGEHQGRPAVVSRTETPLAAAAEPGRASQVRDDVRVTFHAPPNVAEVGPPDKGDHLHDPEPEPEREPERKRDHVGRAPDDPRINSYVYHEDRRPANRPRDPRQ